MVNQDTIVADTGTNYEALIAAQEALERLDEDELPDDMNEWAEEAYFWLDANADRVK